MKQMFILTSDVFTRCWIIYRILNYTACFRICETTNPVVIIDINSNLFFSDEGQFLFTIKNCRAPSFAQCCNIMFLLAFSNLF